MRSNATIVRLARVAIVAVSMTAAGACGGSHESRPINVVRNGGPPSAPSTSMAVTAGASPSAGEPTAGVVVATPANQLTPALTVAPSASARASASASATSHVAPAAAPATSETAPTTAPPGSTATT